MHEDKAKEVCHICAKEFRDLKHHILYTHQGGWATVMDKPCPEPGCKRMFRSEAAIQKHVDAVHLNKKSQCPQCQVYIMLLILMSWRFCYISAFQGWFKNLSTHISQIHKNAHKYPCPQCGKTFSKMCDVRLHVERVHNGRRYVSITIIIIIIITIN